ncbi:hypothetical protein QOT17_016230 [Balamuthia mandrillaris]
MQASKGFGRLEDYGDDDLDVTPTIKTFNEKEPGGKHMFRMKKKKMDPIWETVSLNYVVPGPANELHIFVHDSIALPTSKKAYSQLTFLCEGTKRNLSEKIAASIMQEDRLRVLYDPHTWKVLEVESLDGDKLAKEGMEDVVEVSFEETSRKKRRPRGSTGSRLEVEDEEEEEIDRLRRDNAVLRRKVRKAKEEAKKWHEEYLKAVGKQP